MLAPTKLSPRITTMIRMDHTHVLTTFHKYKLDAAPDNLIAVGKLAEIHQRTQQAAYRRTAEDSTQVAPGQNPQVRSADQRVLAELQAWLDVIGQRRLARHQ